MNGLRFTADPRGAVDYIHEQTFNVLEAVRVAMSEAMAGLAGHAAANAPVHTGALRDAILASPTVRENARTISGTVSGFVGAKPEAIWLERGVRAAIPKRAKAMRIPNAGGGFDFIKSRGAIPAHPFMNRSLREYEPRILEIIAQRVREVAA